MDETELKKLAAEAQVALGQGLFHLRVMGMTLIGFKRRGELTLALADLSVTEEEANDLMAFAALSEKCLTHTFARIEASAALSKAAGASNG